MSLLFGHGIQRRFHGFSKIYIFDHFSFLIFFSLYHFHQRITLSIQKIFLHWFFSNYFWNFCFATKLFLWTKNILLFLIKQVTYLCLKRVSHLIHPLVICLWFITHFGHDSAFFSRHLIKTEDMKYLEISGFLIDVFINTVSNPTPPPSKCYKWGWE